MFCFKNCSPSTEIALNKFPGMLCSPFFSPAPVFPTIFLRLLSFVRSSSARLHFGSRYFFKNRYDGIENRDYCFGSATWNADNEHCVIYKRKSTKVLGNWFEILKNETPQMFLASQINLMRKFLFTFYRTCFFILFSWHAYNILTSLGLNLYNVCTGVHKISSYLDRHS